MASGTITQGPSSEARRAAHERELIEYERYIDLQLTKTARQVQGMDIATGLMCWLAGALAYLLAAAAADHWLLSGGLGTWGRWLALLGLVAGSGWFLAIRVLPPLLKRINPVYSAHTIEQGRPQLKNSLVNFLLLRRDPRELSEAVRDALQSQAASGLAAAPVEHSIDRSPLVRFALVLLGAVLLSALYIMLSPKDPLRSAARVMFPWASIDRPTRFTIEDIQAEVVETARKFTGGPAEVFYGQRIKISAAAANRGRVVAEPIVLRFSTADGSASDQELRLESREHNAEIVLPAGTLAAAAGGGLQQSFDYTLTAGDAIAGPFHVKVLAAPSIEIEKLEYDFPAYTKLPKRAVTGRADVSALEGTVVTVRARANQEIAQAWIDLDCDGRRDATMLPKGQEAGGNFKLALKDDRRTPVNASYLLRFKNADGFENPQPIRYRIDVTPDLAPEIAWTAPREIDEPRTLPVDEALEVAFSAGDKDFELAGVKLRVEVETENKADRKPWETALLSKPSAEKWTSPPTKFVPAQHGFQAGQTVVLWAEASDNRQPKANVTETAKLKITLLPPRDPAEKRGPNHQPNDGSQQKKPGDAEQPPQDGEKQDQAGGEKQPKQKGAQEQPGAQEQQPGDKESEGEQQREGKEGGEGEQQEKQPGDEKQPGEAKQPGDEEQQAGDGEKKPGQEGEASENEQQGGAGESSEEGESGEGGQGGAGGKPGNEGAAGDKEGDGQSGGSESSTGSSKNGKQSAGKPGTGDSGNEGEPGQAGQGASGQKKPARRVDPDAQDGEAFERMMQHFDEEQKQSKQKGAGSEKQPGEKQAGNEQGAEGAGEESKSPEQAPGEEGGDAEAKEGSGKNAAKPKPEEGGAQSGQPQEGQEAAEGMEKPKPADGTGKPQAGDDAGKEGEAGESGAQERAGEDQNRGKESSKAAGEQSKQGDNQPSAENQRSGGAGQGNEEESGATPEAQGDNKQRDKDGEGQGGQPKEGQEEPQSPSTSNHQSNSKGGQSGSESGGGSKGGGQNAEQEGTGSSGSHTEADDGGGAADQSGDGETGNRGGGDRASQNATGDKNAQKAPGAGREGEGNQPSNDAGKEGGKKGSQDGGKNSAPQKPPQKQSEGGDQPPGDGEGQGTPNGSRESGPSRAGNNEPVGGGQGGDESEPPPPKAPQELGGDAANQDYANRATELVLDRLKDQLKKGQPDEALLDKLQWSKEDLERFVKRWEEMKANAKQPGPKGNKAKDELDQALKGLGLRPKGTSTKAGKTRQDKASGIRDSRRSEPPAEYAEQYQQYNVGTSKGK